jgi:hypothetical protein
VGGGDKAFDQRQQIIAILGTIAANSGGPIIEGG